MTTSHADRLRRAHEELLTRGNLDAVEELFAADYVVHAGSRTGRGTRFVRRWVRELRRAIPDLRVVEFEVLARSRDTLSWRRTLRGTHAKALKGIPASGRRVTWSDLHVTRFRDGRIAEEWAVSELAGALFAAQPRG